MIRIAALVMFLGIALGAFGAHGLGETLARHDRHETWNTAVLYHLIHGVALFAFAAWGRAGNGPFWCWLLGVVVFSGSLYALSLTNFTKLGAITPIGGLLFLVGWAWLIIAPGKS